MDTRLIKLAGIVFDVGEVTGLGEAADDEWEEITSGIPFASFSSVRCSSNA
jgi:hypothetical protein